MFFFYLQQVLALPQAVEVLSEHLRPAGRESGPLPSIPLMRGMKQWWSSQTLKWTLLRTPLGSLETNLEMVMGPPARSSSITLYSHVPQFSIVFIA